MAGMRTILDGIFQASGSFGLTWNRKKIYQVLQAFLNLRCQGFLWISG